MAAETERPPYMTADEVHLDGPAARKFHEDLEKMKALVAEMQLTVSRLLPEPEPESPWLSMAKGIARAAAVMQMHDDTGDLLGGGV